MNTILRITLVTFALSAASSAMTSCKKSDYEEKLRVEMEARLENERQQMQSQQSAAPAAAVQSTASTPSSANATVIREGGYTNVRSGAGSNYGVVEKIKDGSPIRVGRNVGGWYEVLDEQGGLRGYMHASKVVLNGQSSAPAANVASTNLGAHSSEQMMSVIVKREGGYTNLRQGPGTNYGIVQKVRDGSPIRVTINEFCNTNHAWVKVYDDNGYFIGYISRSKIMYES